MGGLFTHDNGAIFSGVGDRRYALWRVWNRNLPAAFIAMLNPSTADAKTNDPTIRVLISFVSGLGYGGFYVGNQSSLIATDPKDLFSSNNPIGPQDDYHLQWMVDICEIHICAWGARSLPGRDVALIEMINRSPGRSPKCFALTKLGAPHHPLRMKKPERLLEFTLRA